MTDQTPIKCFRYLAGAFYVQDYADHVHLFAVAMNNDAKYWIEKTLVESHGRPVLEWNEDFHEPINATERPYDTVRRAAKELIDWSEKLAKLRNMVEIQGDDGNWNCSEYHFGMFNGLELALATMEHRETRFRDAPDVFLRDQQSKVEPEEISPA